MPMHDVNQISSSVGTLKCFIKAEVLTGLNFSDTVHQLQIQTLGFLTIFPPLTGGLGLLLSHQHLSTGTFTCTLSKDVPIKPPSFCIFHLGILPNLPDIPRSFPTSLCSLPVSHSRLTTVSQGSALEQPKLLLFFA